MTLEEKIVNKIIEMNKWTKAYDEGCPIVSDKEWDDAYFELVQMEKECNIYLKDSPTQRVNYQVVSNLQKVKHNHPMLSLAKTKDIHEVESFLNNQDFIAMCKMDGLTCSLRYLHGKLISAETRGNGTIGEDILHNALVISNIPKRINYDKELIVDGEVICKYSDFIPFEEDYRNPRNFAAGSIRLLDASECKKRKLTFVAWDIIKGFEEVDNINQRLSKIDELGFTVVPYGIMGTPAEAIDYIKLFAKNNFYPIDGVVFKFLSKKYGDSLGRTEHHFKNAIAYKFYDETYETNLKNIEWTMGRTGVLTPVAIFEPIEIEGTIVSRASLHNVSVMKETLGIPYSNQKLKVYKSNMIIPQIYSAEKNPVSFNTPTPEYNIFFHIIDKCPICGYPTEIIENNGVEVLKCTNSNCEGKLVNHLDHFCGKKGLDIKGLSKATLNKLINWNWLSCVYDLYSLKNYKEEWISKPGFGIKSVDKILNAIEDSKICDLWQFISALGIPLIGSTYAKQIAQHLETYEDFRKQITNHFDFSEWEGFGYEMNNALMNFDYSEADRIASILKIENSFQKKTNIITTNSLVGINVVITGKLQEYKNRDELKAAIEAHGGKVVSSVSSKTHYLINNDIDSTSSKNMTAKKLNIPILSEKEFITKFFDF